MRDDYGFGSIIERTSDNPTVYHPYIPLPLFAQVLVLYFAIKMFF